jgi:PAS domain-containing protein
MPQRPIELILTRQLASYLALPIFLVDPSGTLVFYNEPAEQTLGRRFEETGEMSAAEWSTIFQPTDDAGRPVAPENLPLMVALAERRPAHESLVHDAQYTTAEYAVRVGWGHSTLEHMLAFAMLAQVKHLVTFHHDPAHDDETLDRITAEAVRAARPPFPVTAGAEGATFEVG